MPEVTIPLSFRLPYKLAQKNYVVSTCPVLDGYMLILLNPFTNERCGRWVFLLR